MKILATFSTTFKIIDFDLFNELNENGEKWESFLFAVQDSVSNSEDWTKRYVSASADELWWEEGADSGELMVYVTFEIDFANNLGLASEWINDIKSKWEVDLPANPIEFTTQHFLNLVTPSNVEIKKASGPLFSIVRWGTLIADQHPDSEGCFLQIDNDDRATYLGKVFSEENRMNFSQGQFIDSNGKLWEIYGGPVIEDYYIEPEV